MNRCREAQLTGEQGLRVGINATPLLSPRTGIGNYVFLLGNEFLASREIRPRFFYMNGWSDVLRKEPVPNIDSIKTRVRRYVPRAYDMSRAISQRYFSRGVKNSPIDIYHEPNYLAYRFDGPTVVTVHDLSWVRHPDMHPKERLRAIERFFPASLARASAIITDCQFVKNEVNEVFGVPPEKIHPVLLGVSSRFFPMSAEECGQVLKENGLDYGRYFLSVGTLEPRKNIVAVIDAFSKLPAGIQATYPLVLIGMRGWLTNAIEARIRPMAEKGLVRPLGYVPDEHMPIFYSGAKAFIFPSLYEGFGLPVLEAMASGTPVIASDCSSIPEVVGDAGELLASDDIDGLTGAMRRIIEDDAWRHALSRAGVEQAAAFSWQRTAQETIDVYRHVLGRG